MTHPLIRTAVIDGIIPYLKFRCDGSLPLIDTADTRGGTVPTAPAHLLSAAPTVEGRSVRLKPSPASERPNSIPVNHGGLNGRESA